MIVALFLLVFLFGIVLFGVMLFFASEILFLVIGKIVACLFFIGMLFVVLAMLDGPNLINPEATLQPRRPIASPIATTAPPHPEPPPPPKRLPTDVEQISRDESLSVESVLPAETEPENPSIPGRPIKVVERLYHDAHLSSEKVIKEVPAWVSAPARDSHSDVVTISSQRFATAEEAWSQLEKSLTAKLTETGWISSEMTRDIPLKISDLRATGAILKECQITWPLEIGGFTEQVQQVVVEVRLTSELKKKIDQTTRDRMGRQNLARLAWGFGILTLVMAGSSLAIRRR